MSGADPGGDEYADDGVFLSAEGLARARQAFEAMREISPGPPLKAFTDVETGALFEPNWTSFDDVYLAFYVMNLVGGAPGERPPKDRGGMSACLRLRAMLDLPFPKVTPDSRFEDTLVSEFTVASIINFRKSLERLLPYTIVLSRVDLGCVFLEFSVLARALENRAGRDPEAGIPRLNKSIVEFDRTWNDLAKRFKVVAGFELLSA